MFDKRLARYMDNEKNLRGGNFSLKGISALLEKIGSPHRDYEAVHIAGTNGKGSTAYALESILRRAGYTTGLYTSPHLININERISIDKIPISDVELSKELTIIIDAAEMSPGNAVTFFDIITAAAFHYFSKMSIDIAIIETGLGGRLDSTNVISPLCSIITDIAYDHTALLGESIEEIACEKGGIIKKDTPVISTNTGTTVAAIIQDISGSLKAPLLQYGTDFTGETITRDNWNIRYNYKLKSSRFSEGINNLLCPSPLTVQVKNTSAAVTAAIILRPHFPSLNNETIRTGLEQLEIPGRLQFLSDNPPIIYDPAHNRASMRELLNFITDRYKNFYRTAVISFLKDKAPITLISIIAPLFSNLIYHLDDDKRRYYPDQKIIEKYGLTVTRDTEELYKSLLLQAPSPSFILFTGTFRIYETAYKTTEKIKNSS